jgi:phosphoglucomutase
MKTMTLPQALKEAKDSGHILPSAYENVLVWNNPKLFDAWIIESIKELVAREQWDEINDRFYKTLVFGTGGLRGRTIGNVVTQAEQGSRPTGSAPEHPAAGTNCMNDFNVRRVTIGLVSYVKKAGPLGPKPHLVFAHDTRHFSRHFAELAACTVIECGGIASVFESERSTPELSFAIRHLKADSGVVVTASHNPPHDNGYKAYFNDGAQVIEPHASGIIREVGQVPLDAVSKKLTITSGFQSLSTDLDKAYIDRLKELILEPEIIRKQGPQLKIIYSPLHGTGAKIVPSFLKDLGIKVTCVLEQMIPDGRFPTVKSPNPENAEALTLSIKLADEVRADVVLATDPDADRMGVAVRNREGKMELLNGNQIGSLLAYYRLERLFAKDILNEKNKSHTCLIKTVVTTDLQKAIAEKFGVGIPETLTGFKYIGEKLRKYEERATKAVGMDSMSYRQLPEKKKQQLLLEHSFYYVFGGEESYGYSASDFARDKDANAACIMFAELAAYAQSQGKTVLDYLNHIYSELGFYQEKLGQLVYEGAEGAAKIQNILKSYEAQPPSSIGSYKVKKISNYAKEDIRDTEGDLLPKELLLFVDLENGSRYAVRGSGTEPKIKFYMFGRENPTRGKVFSESELAHAKTKISQFLTDLWSAIEADARKRAE